MAPPSPLAIATSSLHRLVKEESTYHKELAQQEARLQKLEADEDDENQEFMLGQQVRTDASWRVDSPNDNISSEGLLMKREPSFPR